MNPLILLALGFGGCALVYKGFEADEDGDGLPEGKDCNDKEPLIGEATQDAYADTDNDGFGAGALRKLCELISGYSTNNDDCDDADASINPSATEQCDASDTDEDCDGASDDDDSTATGKSGPYYTDADADGYGDPDTEAEYCDPSSGMVLAAGDCDDADNAANPIASEICNDLMDNDCNASTDSLCRLSGSIGADIKISGNSDNLYSGYTVLGTEDADGNEFEKVIIGVPYDDVQATNAGALYCIYGPGSESMDLGSANGILQGEEEGDLAGFAADAIDGDFDGDGTNDLLVGAPGESTGGEKAGAAYVFSGVVTGTLSLRNAGAKFYDEHATNEAGYSVSGAGDVDRDGTVDLLVGAPYYYDSTSGLYRGAAYLVLGPLTGTGSFQDDAEVTFVGVGNADYVGRSVNDAGDLDGDGYPDLVIGAFGLDSSATDVGGACILLEVRTVTSIQDLTSCDALYEGEATGDEAGWSVDGVGDHDGDGYDDLVVGAKGEDTNGIDAGVAYLLAGPFSTGMGSQSLSTATTKLLGKGAYNYAGYTVSGLGDIDNDGLTDVGIGAPAESPYPGDAYILYGSTTGTIDLATAATLAGENPGDKMGISIGGGFDFNGDSYQDTAVGSIYDDEGGSDAGAAFIVLGKGF